VVLLKSLTSAAAVGLGLPVGVIGPTFVIGAAFGGLMGMAGTVLHDGVTASTGFYVMLGMAAMMAAVLQAPLAALMAVLELTANPNVILPAMLIIVVATMVTAVPLRQRSVFLVTLTTLGLEYPPNPVRAHLRRAGVTSIMNRSFVRLADVCPRAEAREALAGRPRWIVVEAGNGRARAVLAASDLKAYLEDSDALTGEVHLMEIPARRRDVAAIDYLATVEEAQAALRLPEVEALCVRRTSAALLAPVRGVIIQEDIDNYRESAT
jgi:CIC family chloride channel protein